MKNIFLILLLIFISQSTLAITTRWNGFISLVAGEIVSGDVDNQDYNEKNCPCFIADYHEGSIYEYEKLSFEHESRIGGQLNLGFTDGFST